VSLRNKIIAAVAAGSILGGGITGVVRYNEGYSEKAYWLGDGKWTICYGETNGVKRDQTATRVQCDAQLRVSIAEHAKAFAGLPESFTDVQILGMTDFAYNTGVPQFRNGSVYSALKTGDGEQAGLNVLKYKYITYNGRKFDCSTPGNKVCYGVWKRRLWESKAMRNEFKSVQEAMAAQPK